MPVPSSYNDITQNSTVRDFVGWAWYDRTFFAPNGWNTLDTTVFLRFGSVHYAARVWLNGVMVTGHFGGHLPLESNVTKHLRCL